MLNSQKTWHILGAGAIGCLWAVRLHAAGVPVRLILSPRRAETHASDTLPISLIRNAGRPNEQAKQFELPIASKGEAIHQLLLATKANDVLGATTGLGDSLQTEATIVTLGNGMGYHQQIADRYQQSVVLAVTTTDGAYRKSANELVLAGTGYNKIAAVNIPPDHSRNGVDTVASSLSVRGQRLKIRRDCQRMLLDKLLINACINGLTAIHQCPNGHLLSQKSIKPALYDLLKECQQIARDTGQIALAKALPAKVFQVVQATATNYSSTYTDTTISYIKYRKVRNTNEIKNITITNSSKAVSNPFGAPPSGTKT